MRANVESPRFWLRALRASPSNSVSHSISVSTLLSPEPASVIEREAPIASVTRNAGSWLNDRPDWDRLPAALRLLRRAV